MSDDDDDQQKKMDDDDYLNAMAEFDPELAGAMGHDGGGLLVSSDDEEADPAGPRKYEARKDDAEDDSVSEDTDSDDEEMPEDRPYGFKLPAEELRYRRQLQEWADRDAAGKPRLKNKVPFDSSDLLPRVYFDIAFGELQLGRMIFILFPSISPKACENFRALTTGEKGLGRTGHPLSYQGCYFHRVVSGFCAQGGDTTRDDGSGGESIYGRPFEDELQKLHHHHHHHHNGNGNGNANSNDGGSGNSKDDGNGKDAEEGGGDTAAVAAATAAAITAVATLAAASDEGKKHEQTGRRGWFGRKKKPEELHHVKLKRGRLITASAGPNCNRSQFCVLFNSAEWLLNRCGVIGTLDSGEEILIGIELGGTEDGHPSELFRISKCGQLVLENVAKRKKLTSRQIHYDLVWVES
jgi:cyclophilin family peptidyl-prolyl cis-trans isomerase